MDCREVATTPTVYGIETQAKMILDVFKNLPGCNNTYRLRY